VRTGRDAERTAQAGDLVWKSSRAGGVWNLTGDSALLIDPQDRVISKVDVTPETS
jgi:hypothetical protein